VAARIDALLVDIDGVLTTSWRPIPGAPEALAELRASGPPLVLVTNTTSRTRDEIAALLVEAGFDVARDDVLTTAAATAAHLRAHHPGARVELLNSGDLRSDFGDVLVVDGNDAHDDAASSHRSAERVVVLGGAGPEFSYDAVNRAFSLVAAGAPLLAMNPNLVWQTSSGLQLDAGAYLIGIERAAGVHATVTGKPAPAFFSAALDHLGARADGAVMVGDDLRTDVLGAQACGIRGVLVRTGKFRPEQLAGSDDQPEVILDSFADLPAWLRDQA
jgi:HAD superfamily hydrolase (TIGR01458 family)